MREEYFFFFKRFNFRVFDGVVSRGICNNFNFIGFLILLGFVFGNFVCRNMFVINFGGFILGVIVLIGFVFVIYGYLENIILDNGFFF